MGANDIPWDGIATRDLHARNNLACRYPRNEPVSFFPLYRTHKPTLRSSITLDLARDYPFDRLEAVKLKAFQVEHDVARQVSPAHGGSPPDAERIIVLHIRGVITEMRGNAATHGAFAVLSTGEKLHPDLQPLHYDRAGSLSTHVFKEEELVGQKSVTFDISDFAGNPIDSSKLMLWFDITVR